MPELLTAALRQQACHDTACPHQACLLLRAAADRIDQLEAVLAAKRANLGEAAHTIAGLIDDLAVARQTAREVIGEARGLADWVDAHDSREPSVIAQTARQSLDGHAHTLGGDAHG